MRIAAWLAARPVAAVATTFAIAAAGGLSLQVAGFPAGAVSGSILGVAAASLMGVPTRVPKWLVPPVFLLLGVFAGTGARPETLQTIATWPLSFAILCVSVGLVIAASYAWLTRIAGWDGDTALFAVVPGALSFVLAAAADTRADMRRVTVTQTLRLLVLVALLPPVIVVFTGTPDGPMRGDEALDLAQLALLLGAGALGGLLLQRTRLPGGLMLGGLVVSAGLFVSGAITTGIPDPLMIAGQISLGAIAGSRFRPEDRAILPAIGAAALIALLIGVAISVVAALAVTWLLDVHVAQALLAFGPGALEALTILAFALDADPAYVAAHHLVRFLALALAIPVVARWIGAKRPR